MIGRAVDPNCAHEVPVDQYVRRRYGLEVASLIEKLCSQCGRTLDRRTLFMRPADQSDMLHLPDLSLN